MDDGSTQRVVALVDMDCFYCQVESRVNPSLQGKPVAVVQYYTWKGGGIIAVNYEAKSKGVVRGMRGSEAKKICPDINLVSVPVLRGKADLSKYREAGDEVAEIFSCFSGNIQRASIDEAYIDLTNTVDERIKRKVGLIHESQLKTTYVVGFSELKTNDEESRSSGLREWINIVNEGTTDLPEFRLAMGGLIVEEMREKIFLKTGFHCSAGIAHNKMLAKIIAGLHKPKNQTILPQDFVLELYQSLPIYKIKKLGGKFGKIVTEKLSVKFMSDLYKYSLKELQQQFDEKSGLWLYNIARGIDLEPVSPRLIPESIGCSKNFMGQNMLTSKRDVKHWVGELSDEISERLRKDLEKNKRRAKLLTVSLYQNSPVSRSESISSYEAERIAVCALRVLKKFNNAPESSDAWHPPIKHLGLSVSRFVKEFNSIDTFFKKKADFNEDLNTQALGIVSTEMHFNDVSSESKAIDTISEAYVCQIDKKKEFQNSEKRSFFMTFLNTHGIQLVGNSYEDANSVHEILSNESSNVKTLDEHSSSVHGDKIFSVSSNAGTSKEMHLTSGGIVGRQNVCCIADTSESRNETKLCEECDQNIKIIDFFEHLDYHVAVRFQEELNREIEQKIGVVNRKSTKLDIHSKRKNTETVKSNPKQFKDIKSFFQPVTK